mmetsp:Transcript_20857/g.63797  ORF Transcript_20857/g.63797 Transcript_20857/m.63797 type:complete len:234 (-) Transcript_20857:786-1487(-)
MTGTISSALATAPRSMPCCTTHRSQKCACSGTRPRKFRSICAFTMPAGRARLGRRAMPLASVRATLSRPSWVPRHSTRTIPPLPDSNTARSRWTQQRSSLSRSGATRLIGRCLRSTTFATTTSRPSSRLSSGQKRASASTSRRHWEECLAHIARDLALSSCRAVRARHSWASLRLPQLAALALCYATLRSLSSSGTSSFCYGRPFPRIVSSASRRPPRRSHTPKPVSWSRLIT